MDLKKHIRSIPDYPKKGILFRDITTLIKDAKAFKYTNDKIIELAKKTDFDKIAAIESRGFVFASAVSYQLEKPFILLRKKNKLPAEVHSVDFELEYGTATIEVHKDSIEKGEKILIIDDVLTAGTAIKETVEIIQQNNAKTVAAIVALDRMEKDANSLTFKENLEKSLSIPILSIATFEDLKE